MSRDYCIANVILRIVGDKNPPVSFFLLPFLTGVVFLDVCDAGGLPPEGVVEVGLDAAGLALVEEVFGVAGFAAAGELLLMAGARVEPVAGDATAGLKTQKK